MKFKVGDRVKVIGRRSNSANYLFGREGIITAVVEVIDYGHYVHMDIERELGSKGGGLWFTDIELSQSYLNEKKMKKLLGISDE